MQVSTTSSARVLYGFHRGSVRVLHHRVFMVVFDRGSGL